MQNPDLRLTTPVTILCRADGGGAQITKECGRFMGLSEREVEASFINYLVERGWDIQPTPPGDYTDVVARRGAELLVCELKGETRSSETAIDIGYGQILRAMTRYPDAAYALVVPETLQTKAQRVSIAVRQKLNLHLYLVPTAGEILIV